MKARKKVLVKGRKLNEGRSQKALPATNLDELVGVEKIGGDGPQQRSTWVPKKTGQWLQMLDVAAGRKRKHPAGDEGDDI